MADSCIYVHTCMLNGKSYVGQTTQGMGVRWAAHLKSSRYAKTLAYNAPISKAIRKYGAEAFEHRVLSVASSPAELDNLERIWIILLQTKTPNGYNIQAGGGLWTLERRCNMMGKHEMSPEGRAVLVQIGKRRKGCKQPQSAVDATAAKNRGRVKSVEERAKLSAALMGHVVSDETRRKQSEAKIGKKQSAETRAKKSAAKSTPEARKANSERVKAYWAIPENREKLRQSVRMWGASSETRAKLSASAKARYAREKGI